MSSAEENKTLVRRFIEAQDKGDLETLDDLLAPDFVDHSLISGQEDAGRESFMQATLEQHAAYSSFRTTIEYQATDGDDMHHYGRLGKLLGGTRYLLQRPRARSSVGVNRSGGRCEQKNREPLLPHSPG
jgi:SnoaL-like domain